LRTSSRREKNWIRKSSEDPGRLGESLAVPPDPDPSSLDRGDIRKQYNRTWAIVIENPNASEHATEALNVTWSEIMPSNLLGAVNALSRNTGKVVLRIWRDKRQVRLDQERK
jgi:hypothetical protein